MDAAGRPRIRAIVSFPLDPHPVGWSASALVSLETAAELSARGWIVLVDPASEAEFNEWERGQRAMTQEIARRRRWLDV